MKNAIKRDEISRDTGCICFEIEAVGMTYIPNPFSIRGISDYSDGHKNDSWHDYASLAAAVGARELLQALSPPDLERCRFYLSPKEVNNLINGAEAYSRRQHEDPESLRGILRKLTERQELMEQLINRDVNDLKNSNKDDGDDPRLVELKNEVAQLKQSHRELKDCFEKLQKLAMKFTLSRENHVTRREWEQLVYLVCLFVCCCLTPLYPSMRPADRTQARRPRSLARTQAGEALSFIILRWGKTNNTTAL
jgi:hypothetical protein